MANPQLEKGYTKIANEILDKLIEDDFSASEYKILLLLIRQSYGYKRKEAQMSRGFVSKKARMHEKNVQKTIQRLIRKCVIFERIKPTGDIPRTVELNKNYEDWLTDRGSQMTPRSQMTPMSQTAPEIGSQMTPERGSQTTPHKIKNLKEKRNKKYIVDFSFSLDDFLSSPLWVEYPKKERQDLITTKVLKQIEEDGAERVYQSMVRYLEAKKGDSDQYLLAGGRFFAGAYKDWLPSDDEEERSVTENDGTADDDYFPRF